MEQELQRHRAKVVEQINDLGISLNEYASLKFVPEDGRPSYGRLDKNGRFVLACFDEADGVLVGKHRVEVNGAEEINTFTMRWHAPKKYANIDTSGLEFEISEPTDNLKIEVTWDGGEPFLESFRGR